MVCVLDYIPPAEHAAIRAFTSTYDCAAGIQAAYTYAKTIRARVFVPSGLFNVGSTITLDGSISFVGEGCSGSNLDIEFVSTKAITMFKWTGAANGTVFDQTGRIGGIELGNFAVDCNNLAATGMRFDRIAYSRIFSIFIANWAANVAGSVGGFVVKTNPAFSADNMFFNDIGPLYLRGPNCCLRLATFDGANGNACHNTFRQMQTTCRGGTVNSAIIIEDADNNCFQMTYTDVLNYPTDYGLVLQAAARSNYFFHFQGAISALAGSKNAVFGFDRENGQPAPTVASGAELFWTETGNNAQLWSMTEGLRSLQSVVEGNTSSSGLGPDPSRFSVVRTATNSMLWGGFSAGGVFGIHHTGDGTAPTGPSIQLNLNSLGFFGATPVAKPTVTGAKGGNAALASALTALAALGLITDSST